MVAHLEALFPALQGKNYQVTSPPAKAYNCIAWAAGDLQNWWWPPQDAGDTWPTGMPTDETVTAFAAAFATLGYVVCENADLEPDYEKLAIFGLAMDRPKHAARQLPTGRWTSKIGELEDIEQDLRDLEGAEYGTVMMVMKRPAAASAWAR